MLLLGSISSCSDTPEWQVISNVWKMRVVTCDSLFSYKFKRLDSLNPTNELKAKTTSELGKSKGKLRFQNRKEKAAN